MGGGIYIGEGCSLKVQSGAKVIGNEATQDGGGIYLNKIGAHGEMSSGEIRNNTAGNGGGVYIAGGTDVTEHASFTLKVGTIIANTATDSGGGVEAFGGGIFTMEGGTIENNTAHNHGGGVQVLSGTMNMTGGNIESNTANKVNDNEKGGGGVALGINNGPALLDMSGGTISRNTIGRPGKGAGIQVWDGTDAVTVKMSGTARIDANNDVYLKGGRKITVDGQLNPLGGVAARITPENYNMTTQVLDGDITEGTPQNYTRFTVTPKEDSGNTYYWEVDNQGKLIRIVDGAKPNAWKVLKDTVEAAVSDETITIKGTVKATNDSGNSDEIEINKNLTIKGKTKADSDILDANGNHASTPPSDVPSSPHRIFKITGTAQVHLENLTLQNGKDTTSAGTTGAGGGGIWMADTAHLTLTGVTIRNCTSKGPGGGLCMEHDGSTAGGTLTMKNSRVIDNTVKEDGAISTSSGGGICLPNFAYTAVIDTCEISRNTVDVSAKLTTAGAITVQACGLYTGNSSESKTHIKGHTIIDGNRYVKHTSKNTKVRGIGIWMQGGEVTIGESGKSDAESPLIQNHLVGNANSVEGTAIYLEGSAKVNWKSGQITNNGGPTKAIAAKSGATFNNTSDNTAN